MPSTGGNPHTEPERAAGLGTQSHVRNNDEDALTLVCAEDGATVRVPLVVAATESALIRTMLEDQLDASEGGAVLKLPMVRGGQGMAFAAFLRDQLTTSTAALVMPASSGEEGGFTTLYGAASFLVAPQWQQKLADALGNMLVELANAGDHEVVKAVAEREQDALDPAVSPLLTMLAPEAVAALLVVLGHPVARWAEHELGQPNRRAEGWMVVGEFSRAVRQEVIGSKTMHVVIRPGTTSIDEMAFRGCSSLASVSIPGSVTQIGKAAFFQCSSMTSVSIPDSVVQIGMAAFWGGSSLASVSIPGSVTQIGEHAFSGCSSLASVAILGSVTQIGMASFYGCSSLTSVSIPGSVTQIGKAAFFQCSSMTSVSIPDSVVQIGMAAFWGGSSLASVSIPGSVTQIGNGTFHQCSSLTSVAIPDSVTQIGDGAFFGCSLCADDMAALAAKYGEDIFEELAIAGASLRLPAEQLSEQEMEASIVSAMTKFDTPSAYFDRNERKQFTTMLLAEVLADLKVDEKLKKQVTGSVMKRVGQEYGRWDRE
eukprot:TRINITY_DN10750_c0_g1_i1.p1 TRINITY_DN10750_c0_g1~~TRINITY_DN10750_c0_g1_i1.p1  ORF type:complete len:540 (+),score=80.05 TRINITY_DN10750_c0_g1_i1:106-1725(+)